MPLTIRHPDAPKLPHWTAASSWRPQSLGSKRDTRSRWESLRHLMWDQWEPDPADERPYKWAARIISVVLNLIFAILLIYFMYVQYLRMMQSAEQQSVTMVEFIGRGNQTEGGGDLQPSKLAARSAAAAAASASAAAAPKATPAPTSTATTAPASPVEPQREPQPPTPTNVQLSKPQPDVSTFQLPDTRLPQPSVHAPTVSSAPRSLVERDVGEPVPNPSTRLSTPQPSTSTVVIASPSKSLAERAIADPSPMPGTSSTAAQGSSTTSTAVAGASNASVAGSSQSGTTSNSAGQSGADSTTGPKAGAAPGGWYSDRGLSDNGNSNRNRDGARQGSDTVLKGNDLFDDQGKPKLPFKGSASRNDPPGLVNGEIRDLDRVGTWRKRRPTDAGLPTMGGLVWRPSETMLEEWARRSIQEVRVKIPGTNTTVTCKVSILALGGGCGINNPNLQDQEAIARPPPPVPFKSELNQHNGGRREDQPVEDFGPGAILPGQSITKQPPSSALPKIAEPKRPQFKFGDDKN